MEKWWGPKDFTNPVCKLDARIGGAIRIVMQGPDGTRYPMSGFFTEIIEPEKIVFTSIKEDDDGNAELEVLNTVTFTDMNGKTQMTMKAVIVRETPAACGAVDGMNTGWNQSIDRLAENLQILMNK